MFKTNIINVMNKHTNITRLLIDWLLMSAFELMYHKQKHPALFDSLENANTGLRSLQNYIPLYRRFFSLSETNHNSINLNHRHHVVSVAAGANKNTVSVMIEPTHSEMPISNTQAFIKYSPLLDPIKFLSGKYDMAAADLFALPKHDTVEPTSVHQKKMHDVNNSSYVDSFFTYLTSQVLHTHGFVHGLDFYGSYLANQDEFTINVYDELEYFSTCDFFLKNKNKLFRLDEMPGFDTPSQKSRVTIGEDMHMDEPESVVSAFDDVFTSYPVSAGAHNELVELEECVIAEPDEQEPVFSGSRSRTGSRQSNSDDSCSSRSSDDDGDEFANVDNCDSGDSGDSGGGGGE